MKEFDLTATVALLVSISVASERLVEIAKTIFKLEAEITAPVGTPEADIKSFERKEATRKAWVQVIAVISGMITAFLAHPVIKTQFPDSWVWICVVLGFFASSGSAFWKEILGYVRSVREIKSTAAERDKRVEREKVAKESLSTAAAGAVNACAKDNKPCLREAVHGGQAGRGLGAGSQIDGAAVDPALQPRVSVEIP